MKIVAVTGGGNGIGEAICRRFASEGYTVAVADIDIEAAERVANDVEGHAYRVDVGSEDEMSSFIDNVETHVGPIDVFVSNAGILFGDDPSGAASRGGLRPIEDRWQISWQVNVMAHVYAARSLIPKMVGRGGGCFINVCSAAGLLNQIGDATYATTLARIAEAMRPGGRMLYWNMLVERVRPASLAAQLRPHAALGDKLLKQDKAWFYSRVVVEERLGTPAAA